MGFRKHTELKETVYLKPHKPGVASSSLASDTIFNISFSTKVNTRLLISKMLKY